MIPEKPRSILAPAKVNLFLEVTGRRDDGYHQLQSLTAFADIGDRIEIVRAPEFSFSVRGPFAPSFKAAEKDPSPNSANIAVRAVWEMSRLAQRKADFRITLTKNLPLAAGLGGGSADAAAVVWALLEWWGMPAQAAPWLSSLLLSLGADVPACFACRSAFMSGIGERLSPVEIGFEIPVVLANPGRLCPTAAAFQNYALSGAAYATPMTMPQAFHNREELYGFLIKRRNDLDTAARGIVPEIDLVMVALSACKGARLARMSGSGATCFALFDDPAQAMDAAETLMMANPSWWVRSGVLNRVQRY